MGEFEAIGDAVTGGMLASAVEPRTGEVADDGRTHEANCLNCQAPLTGTYCARCGQKSHVHRSLRAFIADFLAGAFNFEGKFWRTIPMLAWCPGDLTRRYIAGERARYISPIALYLFSVFLMFAVLNFTGALDTENAINTDSNVGAAVAEQKAVVKKLEDERSAADAAKRPVARLDRKLTNEREDLVRLEKISRGEFVEAEIGDDTPQWVRGIVDNAQRNPERVVTSMQDAASKYSWLLIPLSLPFMWLLFPFSRRYRLYDHTVFVTYSLSFMMILVILAGVLVEVGLPGPAGLLVLIPPFHMYRQLRGAYQLGRFSALFRTTLLTTFSCIAGALFLVVVAAVGLT